MTDPADILAAEVVVGCADLAAALAFYTDRLGFRVETIFPADDPAVAVIAAHGVRLRLVRGAPTAHGLLRLRCADPAAVAGGAAELQAPDGTRIQLVPADDEVVLPPLRPSLVIRRLHQDAAWKVGRAGMCYRDLIPDRQGGRFIASHIRIDAAGPVPDYVHFHQVRFQMIYCRQGWVRVVYEDQGPPFVLHAGDCVLQPPRIRHRVLECSQGLEVIEIGSPAEHATCADAAMELPTNAWRPERMFHGQRFVRHEAATAGWQPWRHAGFECRDLGIASASAGLASAVVARPRAALATEPHAHDAELRFGFVLAGGLTLHSGSRASEPLREGDAFCVPAGEATALRECTRDLELLEVALPADFALRTTSGT